MIKNALYQGYLWWNNELKPIVFDGGKSIKVMLIDGQRYVVEGVLWDEEHNLSYTIKYIDGNHVIIETELTKDLEEMSDLQEYISNKLRGNPILLFRQIWQEEMDPLCEGMKVLVPGKSVFVGFKK